MLPSFAVTVTPSTPSRAVASMSVRLSGRRISFSELSANARGPISVTPSGTMTVPRELSPQNASSSITFSDEGRVSVAAIAVAPRHISRRKTQSVSFPSFPFILIPSGLVVGMYILLTYIVYDYG